MAIYYHATKPISRSKGGSATRSAAYQAREEIKDELLNKTYNYSNRQDIEYKEILTPLPAVGKNAWMVDRAQLWNRVEQNENRHDSQLARNITIAIPIELNHQERIDLIREYVQRSYVDRGMIADVCLHDFNTNNPHAHVMLTMRNLEIDNDGLATFGKKIETGTIKNFFKPTNRNGRKLLINT